MTTLMQLCDTYREIKGIIIYKISIIEYHAWKISNRGQSVICQCESSDRFLFFVRIVEEICMTKLHCAKALNMRHNGERGAYESRKPRSQCVKHKKASNRSCFVIFLSLVSPILSIHTEYQIETMRRTNDKKLSSKKKNKKKSCLCTSVYCVLDNLKNFPWCVFRTVFSVSEYFRSASSPSILNESWRV